MEISHIVSPCSKLERKPEEENFPNCESSSCGPANKPGKYYKEGTRKILPVSWCTGEGAVHRLAGRGQKMDPRSMGHLHGSVHGPRPGLNEYRNQAICTISQ